MPGSLSTSPSSVMSPLRKMDRGPEDIEERRGDDDDGPSPRVTPPSSPLDLGGFLRLLPDTIRGGGGGGDPRDAKSKRDGNGAEAEGDAAAARGSADDPIASLFRRLDLHRDEWERYEFFDPSKSYTRNLIATDDETYTLILLCWNAGKESPIHDHPCDGCWMRVCEGTVREARYVRDEGRDCLVCTSDKEFNEGDMAFIEDSMGYHKVGNPTDYVPAVTMHLYSPPFQKCKIWLDPSKASRPSRSCVCYHTEYGYPV